MDMDALMEIHEDSTEKIRSSIKSYVLQINGATNSNLNIIVVVRDVLSGFTLHAEKCT